jgi:hypothetical protein
MKDTDKKALLERLESHGILCTDLSLSGKSIIVHEATGHTSRKFGELTFQIEQDVSIDENTKNALYSLYIPLVSCSDGDIPKTPDDFLWMKNADIETWTKEARKMNPQLFGLLDMQEKRLDKFLSEQELSKKKPKRSRSKKS